MCVYAQMGIRDREKLESATADAHYQLLVDEILDI